MRGLLLGDEEEEEGRDRISVPRLRLGVGDWDGELEGSSFGIVVRAGLDASTLGVRPRGLRRRVWVADASKAKEERFRRPLKLGEGTGIASIASRLTSSALIGRVLVSAMVGELVCFESPEGEDLEVEDLRLESVV